MMDDLDIRFKVMLADFSSRWQETWGMDDMLASVLLCCDLTTCNIV